MNVFLVLAAVLAAAALLFVLPPLLSRRRHLAASRDAVNAAVYRDQLAELDADVDAGTLTPEDYEKARRELEARVVADVGASETPVPATRRGVKTAVAAGIAIPLIATLVYAVVGNPEALSPHLAARGAPQVDEAQIQGMVERLAARMKENPDDVQGWTMLGRSYGVLGRFDDAVAAYRNAVQRKPDDPQLLVDLADALAMSQGRTLQGEPEKLVAKALAIDATNVKARALAGSAAFSRGDYDIAAQHWEVILKAVPPESELAQAVRGSVEEARGLAKKK